MKKKILLLLLTSLSISAFAQHFTHQDTLRGSVTPERAWWDLTYYHLDIDVDITTKTIRGTNTIQFRALEKGKKLQVDLQSPMKITKIIYKKKALKFEQDGNAYFVFFKKKIKKDKLVEIVVHYEGKPQISVNPPWSGGITWKKDKNDLDFIASSCQGDGASLWWPCKDHSYDEVDSMLISVTVPHHLMNVSNGRLRKVENKKDKKTFHWFVNNPINNYGVNINIGDYVHFDEKFEGEKGILDCDYYVLRDNLEAAKRQFKQVPMMLKAFEHWFGAYPFYEDGFKLVEAPYLGMEHQSSVTYGNGFQNGYRGRDLSQTGEGLKFDFIIIHESGHEWFANNITNYDVADMWIHEGFTAYSEGLYLDYHYGKETASKYTRGTRSAIQNKTPIIGTYNVNKEGSGDMYYKGANMLLMLREITNDDEKWRSILRGLNEEFYHKTATSKQIEDYISTALELNLSAFFDQYLRDTRIPIFEYRQINNTLMYRWTNGVKGLNIPVKLMINGEEKWVEVKNNWSVLREIENEAKVSVHPNFYIGTMNVME
ncbi:MAG: M1 family metallopeptidase [Saprospiraceae bacterium]